MKTICCTWAPYYCDSAEPGTALTSRKTFEAALCGCRLLGCMGVRVVEISVAYVWVCKECNQTNDVCACFFCFEALCCWRWLAYWRNSAARTNCSIISQLNLRQPSVDSILILIFVLVCCSSSSAAAGSSSWWCCSKTLILLCFPTQIRFVCTTNTRDGAAAHWRVKVCGLFWTFARTKCTKKFIFTVFAETTI